MIIFVGGGGQREGYWGHILLKTPKIAHISEYLAADSSPDASPDALAIINIRKNTHAVSLLIKVLFTIFVWLNREDMINSLYLGNVFDDKVKPKISFTIFTIRHSKC